MITEPLSTQILSAEHAALEIAERLRDIAEDAPAKEKRVLRNLAIRADSVATDLAHLENT